MKSLSEVCEAINNVIIPYCDCIAWSDFSDTGSCCFNPYKFESKEEEIEADFTHAFVMLAIPKGGDIHLTLAKEIANLLGNKYITYDWCIKAIARVLLRTTADELLSIAILSRKIKDKMKSKGISHINSLQEVLK